MFTNLRKQLCERSKDFIAYSLPVGESTSIADNAHLAIFIFHVGDSNLHIMEEILAFKINTWENKRKIYENICQSVTHMKLPLEKLIGLTTDGAPAICGEKSGLVGRMRIRRKRSAQVIEQHITASYTRKCCAVKS